MIILPDTYYRRRFLDGRSHVFHAHGAGRVVQDNADVLVFDWAHSTPHLMAYVSGWSAGSPRSYLFDPQAMRAYVRSFWWRTRPLNIAQQFNPAGELIVTRIDFATFAHTCATGTYQTDLYLDCFIAPDNKTFLIEDEDEVESAIKHGLMSAAQRTIIEQELAHVVGLIKGGTWVDWLAGVAGIEFDHHLIAAPRRYTSLWQLPNHHVWPEDSDA